jgi:hypothetical protein
MESDLTKKDSCIDEKPNGTTLDDSVADDGKDISHLNGLFDINLVHILLRVRKILKH